MNRLKEINFHLGEGNGRVLDWLGGVMLRLLGVREAGYSKYVSPDNRLVNSYISSDALTGDEDSGPSKANIE